MVFNPILRSVKMLNGLEVFNPFNKHRGEKKTFYGKSHGITTTQFPTCFFFVKKTLEILFRFARAHFI